MLNSNLTTLSNTLTNKIGVKKYSPTISFTQHAAGAYRQSVPLSSFSLPSGAIPLSVTYTSVGSPNTSLSMGFDGTSVYMLANVAFTGTVELQVSYYLP